MIRERDQRPILVRTERVVSNTDLKLLRTAAAVHKMQIDNKLTEGEAYYRQYSETDKKGLEHKVSRESLIPADHLLASISGPIENFGSFWHEFEDLKEAREQSRSEDLAE